MWVDPFFRYGFTNRCLFFAILMMFVCSSYTNSTESSNAKQNTNCLRFNTCRSCAHLTQCSWLLDQQLCIVSGQAFSSLVVHIDTHCPRFSVVKNWVLGNYYDYQITVSNDLNGFVSHIRKTNITCSFGNINKTGWVKEDDSIACPTVDKYELVGSAGFYHGHVVINNTILRIDNETDNYFTFHEQGCGNNKDHDCLTCTWIADGDVHQLRRCTKNNQCTGSIEWYDQRDANNYTMRDSRRAGSSVQVNCEDARILFVDPPTAPWSGGTVVKIVVQNHRILADNRTMAVTVAGRYCAYPKTINGTIVCTVSPSSRGNELSRGPVVVTYSGGRDVMALKLTSPKLYTFVYPSVTDVKPTCGSIDGGIQVTVTGDHLDTGSTVRVLLGGNYECNVVERREDRIVCLTGAVASPATGPITVQFDKSLNLSTNGTKFQYVARPTLAPGQIFEGIVSGGTTVPVSGTGFACAENVSFFVEHGGRRLYSNCEVQNDTRADCRSPDLDNVSRPPPIDQYGATPLTFGVRVIPLASDHKPVDLFPQPDDPQSYYLFHDPEFVGYETDNSTIVIYGRGDDIDQDRGYREQDVAVQFPANPDSYCNVTGVAPDSISCRLDNKTSPELAHQLHDIIVSVGDRFVAVVNRRTYHTGADGYKLFSVVSGIVLMVSLVLLCAKTIRRATLTNKNPLFEMHLATEGKDF